jgi:methylphosphotriester-DNA--protein-cysteine methyltransferase
MHLLFGSQLRKYYQECLGCSPTYCISLRICKEAAALLGDPALLVNEIAWESGVEGVENFTRIFHKMCGQTPNRIRSRYVE